MPRQARKPTIHARPRPQREQEWEQEATPMVLEALRERSMHLSDLASHLKTNESLVHHALSRLQRQGLVESVRGYWIAVEDPRPWRHRR